jgi:hypothetical protein
MQSGKVNGKSKQEGNRWQAAGKGFGISGVWISDSFFFTGH